MQYKNVAMEIIEKLNLLEEALDAPTSGTAENVNHEAFLLISNQKAQEAISGLREASSVAEEQQVNIELVLDRAASEHQDLVNELRAVSEYCSQASFKAEVASSIGRCIKKAQSVHELLFKKLNI